MTLMVSSISRAVDGVDRYVETKLSLRFAAADAIAFGNILERSLQYSDPIVIPLLDAKATKAHLLDALGWLSGKSPMTDAPELAGLAKAKLNDGVFFFFAGHRIARGGRFFLLPHDFNRIVESSVLATAMSDLELASALTDVESENIVLSSTHVIPVRLEGEDPRVGPLNSRDLAQLAYNKGMSVLAASQGVQAAKKLSTSARSLDVCIGGGRARKGAAAPTRQPFSTSKEFFETQRNVPRSGN